MTDQAKKTDAWMPLWIGDYLADTMSLNTAQHGAYLLLLVAYWRNKGPLLDDDGDLASIVRATPGEWKKIRPKMLRFFDIEDGTWSHSRANKELQRAGLYAKKAHDRAIKAANARWGAKSDPEAMQQACSKHATSNAQGELDQCPAPSPLPSIGIPPFVAEEHNPPPPREEGGFARVLPTGTDAGRVCKAMREQGISDGNPSSQALRALLEAGATEGEFVEAARKSAAEQKGFGYAIGIVAGERKRAAALAQRIHRGALPAAETAYQRSMRERMQEAAPESARRDPSHPAQAAEFFNAIEVPTRTVERIR